MAMTVDPQSAACEFLATWERAPGPSNGEAERCLCSADSRLARIIEKAGPQRFGRSPAKSHFDAIARSIIYQQLSKKAAATIYSRYLEALAGKTGPERVVGASPEALRSAGLSVSKVRYLKALAMAVINGDIDLDRVARLPDEAIVNTLTKVPGVGVWTAQMFLMFRLQRLDVLPTRDLGIGRGLQIAYGLRKPAAPGYVARVGKKWAPYRSIASLYLWAAVDLGVTNPKALDTTFQFIDKTRNNTR